MLTHVLAIFFGLVASAVFFFIYKDRGPFVRAHTATEWNFQLTITIVQTLGFVFCFGSVFGSFASASNGTPPSIGLFFLGYFLLIAIRLVGAIWGIYAAVVANRGKYYKYPLAIPFVKA